MPKRNEFEIVFLRAVHLQWLASRSSAQIFQLNRRLPHRIDTRFGPRRVGHVRTIPYGKHTRVTGLQCLFDGNKPLFSFQTTGFKPRVRRCTRSTSDKPGLNIAFAGFHASIRQTGDVPIFDQRHPLL